MPLRLNVVGSTGTGSRLLMLVHGFGADEHDLAGLSSVIDPEGRFFVVCPRGPLEVAPYGGASWYDFADKGADPATFQGSLIALDHAVDTVCEAQGLDRHRAVFAGFSQGGSMVLALSFRDSTKARPAAVASLSGFLAQPDWLNYAWDAPDLPPAYVQHGTYDPMLPVERGRASAQTLSDQGIRVDWHEYPMQHEIRPESIADLRAFLQEV
jgi:phospholipase/carboxylesterase